MQTKALIEFIQTWLKEKGYYTGRVDGLMGPKTLRAISNIKEIPANWSDRRKLVGTVQYVCMQYEVSPGPLDGFWGPSTQHAYETVLYIQEQGKRPPIWRPEEIIKPAQKWPKQYTPEFNRFYGERGSNLVFAQTPYPFKLAWNPSQVVHRFSCHQKVKDSVEKVLTEVLKHYGIERIKELRLDFFGGCYNDRPIRGGSLPSMHSWAIALDFDPRNNQLTWGRDRAHFARPEYESWWRIWESEGWVSLGRQRNFDWMHVQAAEI